MYVSLAAIYRLHFWQNDWGLLRATALTRGWNGHWIKVNTQNWLWRRKFSHRSCRDSNSQPFDHESGALTNKLSRVSNSEHNEYRPSCQIRSSSISLSTIRTTFRDRPFYFHSLASQSGKVSPFTVVQLKVTQNHGTSLPENVENVQIIPYAGFLWLLYQYLYKEYFSFVCCFLASSLISSVRSYVASLFTNEEQKKG